MLLAQPVGSIRAAGALGTCAPPPPPVRSSPLVASLVGGVIGYREWLALSAMARLQLIDGGWDLVGEVGIGVAF